MGGVPLKGRNDACKKYSESMLFTAFRFTGCRTVRPRYGIDGDKRVVL
jgi:hypothetical protein